MKNQTEKIWLKGNKRGDLGTGVFLFSDDEGISTRKVFVENITYRECKKQGKTAFCFKWVPHSGAEFQKETETFRSLPPKDEKTQTVWEKIKTFLRTH